MDIIDIFVLSVFSAFIVAGIFVTLLKSFRDEIKIDHSNEEDI